MSGVGYSIPREEYEHRDADGRVRHAVEVEIRPEPLSAPPRPSEDRVWRLAVGYTSSMGVRMEVSGLGSGPAISSDGELPAMIYMDERVVQELVDTAWAQGVRPTGCQCGSPGTTTMIAGMGLKAGQPVYAYGDEDSVRREMEAKNRIIEGLRRVIDVLAEKLGGA